MPDPRKRPPRGETRPSKSAVPRPGIVRRDPLLEPFAEIIQARMDHRREMEARLLPDGLSLGDFASGHEYFGLHRRENCWVFREWAPNAEAIYLIGDHSGWNAAPDFALRRIGENGVWELEIPPEVLGHGSLYRLRMEWPGGGGDRIPAWTRRVVQDPDTLIFNAQVWRPEAPHGWRHHNPPPGDAGILVYEAHVGMAQEEGRVGTYREFADQVLPRVAEGGYNTVQLMAVQEHPYYGSFGYQVSSFFAASSRFGTPDDLKYLIDAAHGMGLRVIMDLVHSHAVINEVEGLSRFDGTPYQYFHDGPRGHHSAWNSRCFDYGKPEVVHFLLSNCRFWLDEYRFDGFRFDGVTSMLYQDHGLEKAFTRYDDYFGDNTDRDALAYLNLANRLIHRIRPGAVTIAEDVSGMPGLAAPESEGGTGFDYRFAMGIPDYWIKLIKERADEDWPMGQLWYELNNRRAEERTISYCESHDQALVGDQTLMFRLMEADIYEHMRADDPHLRADRAIALHKMIRLITLATAGHGYLNFMGNEFGHPEWIDFPREGNNWSYHYARRQWGLAGDPALKFRFLGAFDRAMTALAGERRLLADPAVHLLTEHNDDKVLIFSRAGLIFAFNFHPARSHDGYPFPAPAGEYRMILDGDAPEFGGHGRLDPDTRHLAPPVSGGGPSPLRLYLPSRTAIVVAPT
jgi:1,4-alpha-glucan branching enzyme